VRHQTRQRLAVATAHVRLVRRSEVGELLAHHTLGLVELVLGARGVPILRSRNVLYVAQVGDEPKLLHRNPARNYTHRPYLAARGEPECIDDDTQARYTLDARPASPSSSSPACWARACG
jgi:hypothetical protein